MIRCDRFYIIIANSPRPAPALPKPHYPLKSTISLPPLSKGRWIDGKAQALILLLSVCDTSAFLFAKLFCRQDGGIALHPPTSPFSQSFQKYIHRHASHKHPRLMNAQRLCFPAIVVAKPTKHSCRDREPAFLKKTDFFYKLKRSRWQAVTA